MPTNYTIKRFQAQRVNRKDVLSTLFFSMCKGWIDSNRRHIKVQGGTYLADACFACLIFNEIQTVLNVDGNRSIGTSLMEFCRETGNKRFERDNGTV